MAFSPFTINGEGFDGYTDDPRNAGTSKLTRGSLNAIITKQGVAETRKGYADTEIDLVQGTRAEPFHVPHYDITFFAVGTKVYYYDHTAKAVVDTGITRSADSTFEEYNGVVFVTNQTDGCYCFVLMRLNGDVSSGAAAIVTDVEGAALASAFDTQLSRSGGHLRIGGTDEQYTKPTTGTITGAADNGSGLIRITSTSHGLPTGARVTITGVVGTTEANATWTITRIDADTFDLQDSTFANAYSSGGTWTFGINGLFVLTGTASQDYSDNDLCMIVYNLSSVVPKCDQIIAWKESLHCLGLSVDDETITSDRKQTTVAFSSFASAAESENVLKFGSGTAGTELIGKQGKVVGGIATNNYLYIFKDASVYYISTGDVSLDNGARPPNLLKDGYGLLNKYCVADMGNGEIAFLTQNHRVIRIKIASNSGQPLVYPDETFDSAYINTLRTMNSDQTGARLFYSPSEKRLFVQITADGSRMTLPYNNDIGAWEPPRTGWFFGGYFDRDGVLFATDYNTDTVFECGTATTDNGSSIQCVMTSPFVETKDGRVTCRFKTLELSGALTSVQDVGVDITVGSNSVQSKIISANNNASFPLPPSLGTASAGSRQLGNSMEYSIFGDFDVAFGISPSIGSDITFSLYSEGPFKWYSYTIYGKASSKSLLTLS